MNILENKIYEVPSYEKVTVPQENILMGSFGVPADDDSTTGRVNPQ